MKKRALKILLTKRYTANSAPHYHVNLFEGNGKSLLSTEANGYKTLAPAKNIISLLQEGFPKAKIRCQVIGASVGLSTYEIRNETEKLTAKVLGKSVTSKIY